MSDVTPARIGLLIDYVDDDGGFDENILPSLQLVADEYVERGVLERPVEFVVRAVQGLPNGSFRAVRDAFFELVEQDSLSSSARGSPRTVPRCAGTWRSWLRSPASPWPQPRPCSASGFSGSPRDRWKKNRSSWPRWQPSTAAAR